MKRDDRPTVAKLLLSAANRTLREVLIDRKRLTIGRKPHNDLLLDDLTVSGEHAILHTVAGESVIQDLMSRNGTLINGAPIVRQRLAHGDCVDIGIYRLVFKVEGSTSAHSAPGSLPFSLLPAQPLLPTNLAGARTSAWQPAGSLGAGSSGRVDRSHAGGTASDDGKLRPRAGRPAYGAADPPRLAAPPPGRIDRSTAQPDPPQALQPASLRFLGGHDVGRRVLLERPIVSIRNGAGEVAVVAKRQNGYCLTHMEGLAYPLVNGESIGLGAHLLRDNDLIELGGTILQFSLNAG